MSQPTSTIPVAPNHVATIQSDAPHIHQVVVNEGWVSFCGDLVPIRVVLRPRGFDGSVRLRFALSDGRVVDELTHPTRGGQMVLFHWATKKGDDTWTDEPDVDIRAALLDNAGAVVSELAAPHRLNIHRPVNRTNHACIPGARLRGERWTYADMEHRTGPLTQHPDSPYGWDANYDVEFRDGTFYIIGNIKLVGEGITITDAIKARWKSDIETFWNQPSIRAHYTSCDRGPACPDTFHCCKFDVRIVCNFVEADWHTIVRVKPGQCPGPWGAPDRWWYSSLWWELEGGTAPNAPAPNARMHEFGHNIGLWDEYATGALRQGIDPNVPSALPANSTMNNGAPADRHYFNIWFASFGFTLRQYAIL